MKPLLITLNPGAFPLDAILDDARKEPPDRVKIIQLNPGEYETAGPAGETEFQLGPNTHIIGAGHHLTTVKVNKLLREGSNGYGCAFTTWHRDAPNVSVRDLTIDCNYAELSKITPNLSLRGAMLYGSNTVLERVRVINAAGQRKLKDGTNEETFVLTVGAHAEDATGCRISGCIVEDLVPGSYVSAIGLMGSQGKVIEGRVLDCRVVGWIGSGSHNFGLNLQNTIGAQFRNNDILDCERCFGNDTGSNLGLQIAGNRLFPARNGVGLYLDSCEGALVHGNVIQCVPGSWVGTIGKGAISPRILSNIVIGLDEKRAWQIRKGAKPVIKGNQYA